ncbi:ribosome recycling factor [Candidatus Saccharibacteria bacterium]|nr:MAG: ribosome recycling factor [Candidatus Saccharibacteria bacterium]
MNPQQVVEEAKRSLLVRSSTIMKQLKSLRTGRASAAMLDGVVVEAYGTPMPLNQVANVSAPEAQLLQITPFESNLQKIASAIRDNEPGYEPQR